MTLRQPVGVCAGVFSKYCTRRNPLNVYTRQNPRRHVAFIEIWPNAYNNCSLSLWRVFRGSKLMHLDLIHGLFITLTDFRLSSTSISGSYYYAYIQLVSFKRYRHSLCTQYRLQWVQSNPLASFAFLFFSPFCSPFVSPYLLGTLLAVTGSVHLVPRLLVNWSSHFPPLVHIPPIPKSWPPGVFQIQIYIH
jgi:hypothetical protein